MDVDKLYRVANDILTEIEVNDVAGNFTNLLTYISQNTQAGYDSATEVQEKLNLAFDVSVINQYAPTYREIVERLGASEYVGESGKQALTDIINGGNLNIATKLQTYIDTFNQIVTKLRELVKALDDISVTAYEPTQYEIGYVVPTDLNDLAYISKRLTYYSKFISLTTTIAGEKDNTVHLSRVSNGDLEFFVLGTVAVAKVVDKVLSRVVELYKELQNIKQISASIQNINASTDNFKANTLKTKTGALEAMLAMEKELSDSFVDNTVADATKDYKGDDKKEIKVQLGVTIKTLLDDIQNGIRVEVTPPKTSETTDEATQDKATSAVTQSITATNAGLLDLYSRPRDALKLPSGLEVTADDKKELDKELEPKTEAETKANDKPEAIETKKTSKKKS